MMKFNNWLIVLSLLSFGFYGCRSSNSPTDNPTSGKLAISVDETFKPLIDSEITTFESLYTYADVSVEYKSEAEVMNDLLNDSIRLVVVPRSLNAEEYKIFKKWEIVPRITKIAYDGVALIGSKDISDTTITLNDIKSLLTNGNTSSLKNVKVVFDQKRLVENNAMDFEDLLLKPIELFENNSKIHQKYKKRFNYILVDEFQDTNKAQYELLKMLVPAGNKIAVVGDDAQSIYSWRGANIGNMLDFEKDFPKHKIFKLEQNYRSTKIILAAADSVIKNNRGQIVKTLWTENNDGEHLTLIKCSDEKDEAAQIAKYIKHEITKKKMALKDFAVLYRTNAQSRALEDIFRREKIPYKIIGGIEFYKRKEVKDVIAYLRVISNQNDEESLLRIMNFPQRGIGNTTITRMIAFARKHDITLFETMIRVFEVIDIKERIQKNVKNFKILLDKYIGLKDKLSVGELTRALVDELGILRMFKEENTPESISRLENINELLSALSEFSAANKEAKLEQYLEEVSLVADVDLYEGEKNAVTLLTVHSAKGLEFPIIFISGCEEDIFPLSNKFNSDATLEEERRLFYVAVTRAKQKVYLSHARSRYRFGEVAYQSRSRFIDELKQDLVAEVNGGIGRKSSARKSKKEMYYEYFENIDYETFDQEHKTLRPGSRVMHEKFGLGKVTAVTGAGDMQKATVAFEGNNIKQLMLKFAKLKVLQV